MINPFVTVVQTIVTEYNSCQNEFLRKKLRESLFTVVQKWTDVKTPMVSKEVWHIHNKYFNDKNPFELKWPNRRAYDTMPGYKNSKSFLVWEHTTPVNEFVDSLLETSLENVLGLMDDYSGVCWIARHEDDRLNEKGFKSKRPGGWKECYKSCAIKALRIDEV